jgi:hypothetical protein
VHIVEVDEHLDYKRFWEGREHTKAAGRAFWEVIEGLADSYPCATCKRGAQALAHGGHDVVNIHLGKAVQTPTQLKDLYEMVASAWHKYEKHGAGKTHRVEGEHVAR